MIRKPSGCCWLLYRVMITSLSISVSMICISAFLFQTTNISGKYTKKYQQAEIPEPVYDYNWSAEKGRDHYYTQIARDLIDKIAASIYEPGTLLPYEAVLARNYKVSISTIRKSLALLNEIGFAETINTKGTIVRLPPTFITANCMQNERY